MNYRLALVLGVAWVTSAPAQAPDKPAGEDPVHQELRALRQGVVDAVNKNDVDRLLTYLDKDVVVTWMNAEVSKGPEGVRAYFDKMMKGPKRIVESFTTNPTVDVLTHLYGDTGVSYGTSRDHFKLTDGKDFEVETHWSATVAKKEGKWLIANFHASVNVFDNAILNIYVRQTALWTGGGALVAGLLLGLIGGRLWRRRTP